MYVVQGVIYESKDGPYDEEKPQYNCYSPAMSGDYGIVDCWICDKKGNIHPGYDVCPVPIDTEDLGDVVGELGG